MKNLFILLITITVLVGCNPFLKKERWEGISDNELRTFVTIDRTVIDDRKIDKFLLNKSKQRAILFISSYLRMNMKELNKARKLERTVFEIIEKAVLISDNCIMEKCQATYSFNISKIINFVKKENKK